MNEHARNVLPRQLLMTESLFKRLVSAAVCKVQAQHGLNDKDLADLIGCEAGTVSNARNQESKLQGHTLFNLMSLDDYAIDGHLQHFGRRSVPIEAKCSTDELVAASAVVASIARAKSPTSPGHGTITDNELLQMENELDEAIQSLSLLKMRAVDVRRQRA